MEQLSIEHNPPRSAVLVMAAMLIFSIALNVLLARKVRGFERTIASKPSLTVGALVPPITAKRLNGHIENISYELGSQPTVLYVFRPGCTWCARNFDNFKALLQKENQYRVIGLSLSEEGLAEYVRSNSIQLPVYSGLSSETRKTYGLSGTPQTIVVSPEGKVLQNWIGAWVGKNQEEIEAYFHVKLSGLRDLPTPEDAHSSQSSQVPWLQSDPSSSKQGSRTPPPSVSTRPTRR
jgi:peroxiredoxin